MDIIESGYRYRLDSFKKTHPQEIRFTQKLISNEFIDGTTNEEVVDMLIARMYFLQSRNFSSENQCVIILLKSVKELLSKRLTKKIKRNEKSNKDSWTTNTEELFGDSKWALSPYTSGTGSITTIDSVGSSCSVFNNSEERGTETNEV